MKDINMTAKLFRAVFSGKTFVLFWMLCAFAVAQEKPNLKVSNVSNANTIADIEVLFNEDVKWPTKVEIREKVVATKDIQKSLSFYKEWLGRLFPAELIPNGFADSVFGLKHWGKEKSDVLFCEYKLGDILVKIKDSSTHMIIIIQDNKITNPISKDEWNILLERIIKSYFKDSESILANIDERNIAIYSGIGLARIVLTVFPLEHDNSSELFTVGNPHFWVRSGEIIINFHKVLGAYAECDKEYGISNRFPPFEDYLNTLGEKLLTGMLIENYNSFESSLIIDVLFRKLEKDEIVDRLLPLYENNKVNSEIKLALVQKLDGYIVEETFPLERFKKAILNELEKGIEWPSIHKRILEKINRRLHPEIEKAERLAKQKKELLAIEQKLVKLEKENIDNASRENLVQELFASVKKEGFPLKRFRIVVEKIIANCHDEIEKFTHQVRLQTIIKLQQEQKKGKE